MKKYFVLALLALLIIAGLWLFESDFNPAEVDARYTNSESRFFTDSEGARIHYRDQGNPAGEPIVLVHGSNASLHTWEPWLGYIGSHYRVITLDLPAHGLTGAVPNGKYDSAAQLVTVNRLVTHLQVPEFIIGGNSMGGGVSWRYALAYPQQVSAMVLVDASGLPGWREENTTKASAAQNNDEQPANKGPLVFRLLQKSWFRSIAGYLDTRFLTGQGLRAAFYDESKVTEDMIDLYYNMSMRAGTREATLARFTRLGSRDTTLTDASLASLTMPALVLWGETDTLIPASTGERFASVLPNAQLIVYPNVGHLPMEEIPKQSATDLLDFLKNRPLDARTNGYKPRLF